MRLGVPPLVVPARTGDSDVESGSEHDWDTDTVSVTVTDTVSVTQSQPEGFTSER